MYNNITVEKIIDELESSNESFDLITRSIDTIVSLESIKTNLIEVNNEYDGLTEKQAGLVQASVESLLNIANIGVSYKYIGMPSIESFKNKYDRHSLGNITIEGIGEAAKNIFNGIINAIKKFFKWIFSIFDDIKENEEKFESSVKNYKNLLSKIGDRKPDSTVIHNLGLKKKLAIGNKTVDFIDVSNTIEKFISFLENIGLFLKEIKDIIEFKVDADANPKLNKEKTNEYAVESFMDSFSNIQKKLDKYFDFKKIEDKENIVKKTSDVFPGNLSIVIEVNKTEWKFKIDFKQDDVSFDNDELPLIDVLYINNELIKLKSSRKRIQELRKTFKKVSDEAIAFFDEFQNEVAKKFDHDAEGMMALKVFSELFLKSNTKAFKYVLILIKSQMEYINLTLKEYFIQEI